MRDTSRLLRPVPLLLSLNLAGCGTPAPSARDTSSAQAVATESTPVPTSPAVPTAPDTTPTAERTDTSGVADAGSTDVGPYHVVERSTKNGIHLVVVLDDFEPTVEYASSVAESLLSEMKTYEDGFVFIYATDSAAALHVRGLDPSHEYMKSSMYGNMSRTKGLSGTMFFWNPPKSAGWWRIPLSAVLP